MKPHEYIQKLLADALRADAELTGAGVYVFEQNAQELAFMLEQESSAFDAPVAVVTCDKMRKLHSAPAEWELECSVLVTEVVPTNRERGHYMTELDVAFAAAEALDALDGVHLTGDVKHTAPGDGILEAEAKFACRVQTRNGEESHGQEE